MKTNKLIRWPMKFCWLGALLLFSVMVATGTERGPLRAGAAKVEITPPDLAGITNVWGTQFEGVHDKIYVRALVLDNSKTTAAIVAAELSEFGDTTALRQRIEKEVGIPADNIFIAATHDHNAPRVVSSPDEKGRNIGPGTAAYSAYVYDRILEGLRLAKASLQPARVGVGKGSADVNTNRNELTAQGWKLGVNADFPSDKTVWVVKFETPAGEPIAFFVNYAVHAVVMGPENKLVTGDLPGATSRLIERRLDDKVVALWTSSAAGDQNPKFMTWDTTFTNKTLQPGFSLADSQGQILAEEALRAASRIDHKISNIRLLAAQQILTCPRAANSNGPPQAPATPTAAPQPPAPPPAEVKIQLGLLMIDRIALASVSAEVYTDIYWHLKKDSPYTNTIMMTLTNGRIGYLAGDADYEMPFFGASTSIKRGCVEPGIVSGMLEMMNQF